MIASESIRWSEFLFLWIPAMILIVAGTICGLSAARTAKSQSDQKLAATLTAFVLAGLLWMFFHSIIHDRDRAGILLSAGIFLPTPLLLGLLLFLFRAQNGPITPSP